jgi:hypothetical protein
MPPRERLPGHHPVWPRIGDPASCIYPVSSGLFKERFGSHAIQMGDCCWFSGLHGLSRHHATPPPPLLAGRIETENSPSFKLERYAGIAVSEGIRGRSRKDIHFQARHAAGRLRLPCRAHGAASSLARRRHPQHALGADWTTLCHPQLASSGQSVATRSPAPRHRHPARRMEPFQRARG